MILEHGVSDDDATVWVVVLWFEFDLVLALFVLQPLLLLRIGCFSFVNQRVSLLSMMA